MKWCKPYVFFRKNKTEAVQLKSLSSQYHSKLHNFTLRCQLRKSKCKHFIYFLIKTLVLTWLAIVTLKCKLMEILLHSDIDLQGFLLKCFNVCYSVVANIVYGCVSLYWIFYYILCPNQKRKKKKKLQEKHRKEHLTNLKSKCRAFIH